MSKAKRSLVCVVMSVMMVLSAVGWTGSAAVIKEDTVAPCFTYTSAVITDLTVSSGSAACYAKAFGYSNVTKIHITMSLQQYLALQWTTVGEWEATYNSQTGSLSKSKTLTSSGRYRVKAVYTVYSGSASETITGYSSETYFTYTSP